MVVERSIFEAIFDYIFTDDLKQKDLNQTNISTMPYWLISIQKRI